MSDSALGDERGQSRCRLYADKAAAIGAETIAIHARGLFVFTLPFRQQKTAAQQYMLPSSITRETQSLWCVKRMKGMIRNDRAVKNSGSGYAVMPSEPNQWGMSSHRPTDCVYIHIGIQVIKGNQAWRQEIRKKHIYCDGCPNSRVYMHMVSNHISHITMTMCRLNWNRPTSVMNDGDISHYQRFTGCCFFGISTESAVTVFSLLCLTLINNCNFSLVSLHSVQSDLHFNYFGHKDAA